MRSTGSFFAALLLVAWSVAALADGTLTHLSGPVSVQKADGGTVAAVAGAKVAGGDTVVTGAGAYARLEMTDGGEIVLRPDSLLKIESYNFVAAKPQEDNFVFRMLKGGLRTVTGLVGKRGAPDAYQLKTPTATIGIRGTQFDVRVCVANCGTLPDGTYLAVRFGAVHTANDFGSLNVAAGQVAHIPSQRPPAMLPRDPGVGFTPPPTIPKPDERKKQQPSAPATSGGAPPPPAGSAAPQPPQAASSSTGAQDCAVE